MDNSKDNAQLILFSKHTPGLFPSPTRADTGKNEAFPVKQRVDSDLSGGRSAWVPRGSQKVTPNQKEASLKKMNRKKNLH